MAYTGRADTFLKQLDALVETFPLPPISLMQMATALLGRAFAAEVRNGGLFAHSTGRIPYPRLHEIIANKLETIQVPTDRAMPRAEKKAPSLGSPRPRLRAAEARPLSPSSSPDAVFHGATVESDQAPTEREAEDGGVRRRRAPGRRERGSGGERHGRDPPE